MVYAYIEMLSAMKRTNYKYIVEIYTTRNEFQKCHAD